MKNLFKTLPALLVAVILAAVTSCSDSKTSELLSVAGDDAMAVVLFNPVDLLKSAGATVEGGNLVLPRGLKKDMPDKTADMLKIRGVDYDRAIMVGYDGRPGAVVAMVVKDADEVESSLKKIGCDKTKAGSRTAYYNSDTNTIFVIENNLLVMIDCWDEDEVEKYVDAAFDEASTPLASWKADMLASRGSKTVFGVILPPARELDAAIAFSVELTGAKAMVEAEIRDQDGKETTLSELVGVDFAPVGDMMSQLGGKSLVAAAFGGFKDTNLAKVLDKFDVSPRRAGLSGVDESYLRLLSGGVFASFDMADRQSRRYDNIKNYLAVFGVSAVEGRGDKLLSESVDYMRDNGLTVRSDDDGYLVKAIVADFNLKADGDLVVVSTEERPEGAMSSDDCIAFLTFDVPADLGVFKELPYRIRFGMKGTARVYESKAEAEVEFVGSDKPFLATVMEMSNSNRD